MREYYVYLLRCSDASYYVGMTNTLERRVAEHGDGIDPTCYTYKRRPVELKYVARFSEVTDAIAWEKKIKRWSRAKKEALIRDDEETLKKYAENTYAKRIRFIRVMVRRAHHDTLVSA